MASSCRLGLEAAAKFSAVRASPFFVASHKRGSAHHEVRVDGRWISEDTVRASGVEVGRGVERRAWTRLRLRDGSTRRIFARGKTRGACETALALKAADVKAEDDAAERRQGRRGTVLEYVTAWLYAMTHGRLTRNYALRTIETYTGAVDRCLRGTELAQMSVDDVTRNVLVEALRLMPKGTRPHVVAVLRGAWRMAGGDVAGTPPPSPLEGLELPTDQSPGEDETKDRERRRIVNAARDRVYSAAELSTLLRKLDEHPPSVASGARDLIALAEQTGARIAELVSLRWEDVDLESQPPVMRVRGQIVRVRDDGLVWVERVKSRLSRRDIPLTPEAVAVIRRRQELREEWEASGPCDPRGHPHVFAGARAPHGMPDPDVWKKAVRRAFNAAGHPEMTIHSLRRVVARRLEESGLSRMDVESILGQTEEVRKRHYSTHGIPERGVEALRR
nr:tyrosine-type recombinase/integrase [Brachybacterium equifaecis]